MRYIFWIILLFPFSVFSQIQENFSDGDFTNNPAWAGDASQFIISNSTAIPAALRPSLRLNATVAGISSLYLSASAADLNNYEWQFWIKLSFNPTSGNFARVYLVSDSSDLKGPLNGYFVQIGELNDKIGLCKQTGSTTQQIIAGTVANLNLSSSILRIKVTRDNAGLWTLYSDTLGGTTFLTEGTVTDNSYLTSSYSGVYCKYTAGNITNFYFDEFFIGQPGVDVTPPSITSISVVSQNALDVLFSENVDQVTAETITNYFVNNSIGNPLTAIRDGADNSLVHLTFSTNFSSGVTDSIYVHNVQDLNGNAVTTIFSTFTYTSIVSSFSDDFSDGDFTQNPVWSGDDSLFTCFQNLGNYQLRLNATIPKTVLLHTPFTIQDSTEWRFFVRMDISPSSTSYSRVFLSSDNVALTGSLNGYFLQFGEANATDVVRLFKKAGTVETQICQGTTNISAPFALKIRVVKSALGIWQLYTAPENSNVYQLEASGSDNTITSGSYFGLLAKFSSVNYSTDFYYDDFYAGPIIPDTNPPSVISATPLSQDSLDVLFSEDLNQATAEATANYVVNNSIGTPVIAQLDAINKSLVHLKFSTAFSDGVLNNLAVYHVSDIAGNAIDTANTTFRYFIIPDSFSDDFTDGNFSANPIWLGDDSLFVCDNSTGNTVLQLHATVPKTAVLYTHLKSLTDSMEWRFDASSLISPSSTSYIKIYLTADKADLKSELNGYYLQLGESNATDVIRLYRQTGPDAVQICSGITSISDPFSLKIKVVKTGNNWTILSAPQASSSYSIEGTGTDTSTMSNSYFGLVCKISSSSYSTAYSFDNFYAGPIVPDTARPTITSVSVTSFNAMDVTFSEPVEITSSQDTLNYFLSGSLGYAHTAVRNGLNPQQVHLTFNSNFTGGTNYILTAYNVKDYAGNSTDTAVSSFFYSQSPNIINEHFDDGDFYDNPTWSGKITDFMITPDLLLDLFTVTEVYDTSYLSTSVNIMEDSCEWQFYTKVNISPSSSNFERFYLVSDNADLSGSLHGYFIQIGENGSNDALVVTKQNGTITTPVFRGTDGLVAVNPTVRVKVTRNFLTGEWKLYADATGNSNFQLEGSWTENTYTNNLFYIGPYMRYSTSNAADKFYFDDIYAGKVIEDTIPPSLVNAVLVDSTHLDLQFSENIDPVIGGNVLNYFVNKNIGNPASVTLSTSNYSLVHLTFSTPVLVDTLYTLTISNIKDIKGNQITGPISHVFSYHIVKAFDIVINEIMADPSPVVSMPDVEYLELYNRTHAEIDLTSWKLFVGSSEKVLPQCKIAPDSFLIVVPVGKEYLFQSFGQVVGILSSDGLSNAGTSLSLFNDAGLYISSVIYSDTWYRDNLKKNGGWSLEQIDPMNPCSGENNWKASLDTRGGTPGKKNSVYANNPDQVSPILIHAVILSTHDSLRVFFNEPLNIENLSLSMFTVDNNIGYPVGMSIVGPSNNSVKLLFSQSFQDGIIYTLTVTNTLTDCAGNQISDENSCKFGISQLPSANDIVINEVLFNPQTNGVDYIEVYNRSAKLINFADMKLAMRNATTYQLDNAYDIAVEGRLAFPGTYYVFTTNPEIVKQQYFAENPKNFITMTMPSLNNTSGEIVIIDASLQAIDDFAYNEKMQFSLLTSFKGVALERVNFDRPTSEATNWHSAAQTVGYGTPTYKNSQYLDILTISDEILISPEVFSPDEDGFDDVLSIGYKFSEPGYNATITIYDAKGRLTKKLVSNELLATTGIFTWNGLDENNNKAEIGIYLFYIEVFDLQGKVKKFKKTCVLASKLK